jgi:predicted transcriptional regulator
MAKPLEELLAREDPAVLARARDRASEIIMGIQLAQIRDRMHKTQGDIAQALGVKQPTVAGMEKRGHDLKLSSLKRYVEATGGKLRIDVELPDGSHVGFVL